MPSQDWRDAHTRVRVCAHVCLSCGVLSVHRAAVSSSRPPDADGQCVKGGWWELVQESWTVVSSQSFIPRAGLTELAENGLSCRLRTAVSLPLHGDHALHHPPRPCPHVRLLLAAWMGDLRAAKEGTAALWEDEGESGRRARGLPTAALQVAPGESGH